MPYIGVMPSKVVAVSRGWRRRRIFTLVSATDPPWFIRTTFRLKPFTYNQASTPYLKDGGFYTPLFVWRLEFVLTREGHSLHSKYAGAKARLHSSSIDHSGRTTCLRSRKSATSRGCYTTWQALWGFSSTLCRHFYSFGSRSTT